MPKEERDPGAGWVESFFTQMAGLFDNAREKPLTKQAGKSRHIYICYLPAGRSVLGKTMPEVLSTARGRTVFPNTDRPRPANNVFIFFLSGKLLYTKYLC